MWQIRPHLNRSQIMLENMIIIFVKCMLSVKKNEHVPNSLKCILLISLIYMNCTNGQIFGPTLYRKPSRVRSETEFKQNSKPEYLFFISFQKVYKWKFMIILLSSLSLLYSRKTLRFFLLICMHSSFTRLSRSANFWGSFWALNRLKMVNWSIFFMFSCAVQRSCFKP